MPRTVAIQFLLKCPHPEHEENLILLVVPVKPGPKPEFAGAYVEPSNFKCLLCHSIMGIIHRQEIEEGLIDTNTRGVPPAGQGRPN